MKKKYSKKELKNIKYNEKLIKEVSDHNRKINKKREDKMNDEIYEKSYAFFQEQLQKHPPEVVKQAVVWFVKKYFPNQL